MHHEVIAPSGGGGSDMSLDKLILSSPMETFYAPLSSPEDEDYCTAPATPDYSRTDSLLTSPSSVEDDISDFATDFDEADCQSVDSRDASPLPCYIKGRRSLDLSDSAMTSAVFCFVKNFVGASGSSTVAIDNKIEQAMDLVKSHLMFAVREEVEVLKERIAELLERIAFLESENAVLRASASQDTLSQLAQLETTFLSGLSDSTSSGTGGPGSLQVQNGTSAP